MSAAGPRLAKGNYMTEYMVLLPDNEDNWDRSTPEQREETYARHTEFAARLKERGHLITGGAELVHSKTAKTIRATPEGVIVTDGPYAESVEQLSGFYTVETNDLDDLVSICALLAAETPVEIRALVVSDQA